MKRAGRQLLADLQALGFDHIWTNSKGWPCYVHPDDPDQTEISVRASVDADAARAVLRRAEKIAGQRRAVVKRHAQAVKDRQAADRERARERLRIVQARRDKLLAAAHRVPEEEVQRARALVERRERELEEIEHLMCQAPAGGRDHRGAVHARHTGGGTP